MFHLMAGSCVHERGDIDSRSDVGTIGQGPPKQTVTKVTLQSLELCSGFVAQAMVRMNNVLPSTGLRAAARRQQTI